jgi:hypothetical protein
MPDFSGFTTRSGPGMKLQAILWTEMVFPGVIYVFGSRKYELNQMQRYWTGENAQFFRFSNSVAAETMDLRPDFDLR